MLIHRFDQLNPSAIRHRYRFGGADHEMVEQPDILVKAPFGRTVSARSAAEDSVLPLGWLWASKTAEAFNARARRTTTHG